MTDSKINSGRIAKFDGLHRKLVWITFFRLLVVTVLLGATAVLTFSEGSDLTAPVQLRLYTLTTALYVASILYLLLMRWGASLWLVWIAYLQVMGDVAMAAFLVWLTGGGESLFSFLFSLGIINAAILLYRKGALIAALISIAAFSAVTLFLQLGILSPAVDFMTFHVLPLSRLVFTLFINGAGFLLVAFLASYLSEQERRAGQSLSETKEGLAALEFLHESIVQSVASGILTIDSKGIIGFINRSGEEILGITPEDWKNMPLESVLPDLSRAIGGKNAHSGRGEIETVLHGRRQYVGFSVTSLGTREEPSGLVVVFQDLTALRMMEEQARRNERLAAVGVLAAGLAHEIRNPLSSMSGSIELLKNALPAGRDEIPLMEIVLRETERLDRLIEDFLDFARPSPPKMKEVFFGRLAREAVEVFNHDPAAAFCTVEISMSEEIIGWGDEDMLRRALYNLLLNAAQSMDGSGEGSGRIRLEIYLENKRVKLSVSDEGPGIAKEEVKKIFDPFYTTRERGTGLGLALVHRTVEAHNGLLKVESELGKGSSFIVFLPSNIRGG